MKFYSLLLFMLACSQSVMGSESVESLSEEQVPMTTNLIEKSSKQVTFKEPTSVDNKRPNKKESGLDFSELKEKQHFYTLKNLTTIKNNQNNKTFNELGKLLKKNKKLKFGCLPKGDHTLHIKTILKEIKSKSKPKNNGVYKLAKKMLKKDGGLKAYMNLKNWACLYDKYKENNHLNSFLNYFKDIPELKAANLAEVYKKVKEDNHNKRKQQKETFQNLGFNF